MIKKPFQRKHLQEHFVLLLMRLSLLLVGGSLALLLGAVIIRGLPGLTWQMVSQTPKGGFYMGKGGGVLNAILGSLYLAGGGTALALALGLPLALAMRTWLGNSRAANITRISLDVLWGIPTIVYGAFGFAVMIFFGARSSLLAGILVLALVELPILTRAMDEVIRRMPRGLEHAALALGSTRWEVATKVVIPQMLPGIITAVLLAFGRGIGDAASVLFTAGYTDRLPTSLFSPSASLPLAVFFQLSTPYAAVRQRGYAAALILTFVVLAVSFGSRAIAHQLSKYTVK